jgi:hypothetical protein
MNIDSFTGDIQATLRKADMMLHLPEEGRYDIRAKSKFGDGNNDFPGEQKRRWWVIGIGSCTGIHRRRTSWISGSNSEISSSSKRAYASRPSR